MKEYFEKKLIDAIKVNRENLILLDSLNTKNKDLISYIFLIESMHRGSKINRFLEKFIIEFAPSFALFKDFSIGPFQMKASFYERYSKEDYFMKELLSIEKCAYVLDCFIDVNNNLISSELIIKYHSGVTYDQSYSSFMYVHLYDFYVNYKNKC